MRSGKHRHLKTMHAAVFYHFINGLWNVVYISWNGSPYGTYTSHRSGFLLREAFRLII